MQDLTRFVGYLKAQLEVWLYFFVVELWFQTIFTIFARIIFTNQPYKTIISAKIVKYKLLNIRRLLLLCLLAVCFSAFAEKSIYIPTFSGGIRARYEYLTNQNLGAFKVRNLRLGVDGYVAPILSYRAEVDFADWGKIVLIDGFLKVDPIKDLYFSLGQQRMPFGLAAHRRPQQQYFSNRTFVAKHTGTIRDVGLVGSYSIPKFPLTVQASFFNNHGTGENKDYFTNTYGFSAKLLSAFCNNWFVTASTGRVKRGETRQQMWDAGAYFDNGLWHVEAEYLRIQYVHGLFKPTNACDFFVYRNFPIEKKMIGGISAAVRYDYMSDHSLGNLNEEGKLTAEEPQRHRLTLGATLSLKTKFQADFRINYEKYFFKKDIVPTTFDDDKIVVEVIASF